MTSTSPRLDLSSTPSSATPSDLDATAGVLSRHAENPSAFLALNDGTSWFTAPEIDGLIAYRLAGRRTMVQLGGAFADPADQPGLLTAFIEFARAQRRRVVSVQLMRPDAELYSRHGFVVNQFGADYARALPDFNLRGKKHMQLRNKVSRARRAGVTAREEDPETAGLEAALVEVDQAWLHSKGSHVKELEFMVGERGGPAQQLRRLFVARDETGQVIAYVSFSPAYGARSGWLHDLSRRHPDAPPGVLELIVVTAVEAFQAEGALFLHFGLTPFTNLAPEHEVAGASPVTARILRLLAVHGSAIYPAADQLAYKEKWGLDLVEPEYVAFQGRLTLRALWDLLRLTNAA
jgi:lysylphosphatidylglycerol synthetase-like protein (DUF2156 family)